MRVWRVNRFGYRLLGLVFWLIKAEKELLVWKQMEVVGVGFWKRRKGSVRNVSFVLFPLFLLDIWNLTVLRPCSSFDFIDYLAAYTYSPICLDCLPVCCAYTWGSEFGFGCSSHCRHSHSACRTVLRRIGQRYVSRVCFFFLPFDAFLAFTFMHSSFPSWRTYI